MRASWHAATGCQPADGLEARRVRLATAYGLTCPQAARKLSSLPSSRLCVRPRLPKVLGASLSSPANLASCPCHLPSSILHPPSSPLPQGAARALLGPC